MPCTVSPRELFRENSIRWNGSAEPAHAMAPKRPASGESHRAADRMELHGRRASGAHRPGAACPEAGPVQGDAEPAVAAGCGPHWLLPSASRTQNRLEVASLNRPASNQKPTTRTIKAQRQMHGRSGGVAAAGPRPCCSGAAPPWRRDNATRKMRHSSAGTPSDVPMDR